MLKLHQKGFASLEIILIIVVVILAGGTGYYVYSANKKTSDTLNGAAQVAQNSPSKITKKKTAAKATTPASTQQYLTVKEWGVRVPVPANVNVGDIAYSVKGPVSGTDVQSRALFGSNNMSALVPNCDPSTGGVYFGWIEQYTPDNYQKALASPQDTGVTTGVQLGSYYYVWQDPRANCVETTYDGASPAMQAKIQAVPSDNFPKNMSDLLKNIQTIPS